MSENEMGLVGGSQGGRRIVIVMPGRHWLCLVSKELMNTPDWNLVIISLFTDSFQIHNAYFFYTKYVSEI